MNSHQYEVPFPTGLALYWTLLVLVYSNNERKICKKLAKHRFCSHIYGSFVMDRVLFVQDLQILVWLTHIKKSYCLLVYLVARLPL